LAMPQTPWPEVQPLPQTAPKPTSSPATISAMGLSGRETNHQGRDDQPGDERDAPGECAVPGRQQSCGNPAHPRDPPGQAHHHDRRRADESATSERRNGCIFGRHVLLIPRGIVRCNRLSCALLLMYENREVTIMSSRTARNRRDASVAGLEDKAEEAAGLLAAMANPRSEEHTSELQSHLNLVCRLLLEKKKA